MVARSGSPVDATSREESEERGHVAPVLDARPRRDVARGEGLEKRVDRVLCRGWQRGGGGRVSHGRHAERLRPEPVRPPDFRLPVAARLRGRLDGPAAALARSISTADSSVTVSGLISRGSDAFVVPSVTYGPYRPSRSRTGAADSGWAPSSLRTVRVRRDDSAVAGAAAPVPRRSSLRTRLHRSRASGTRLRASRRDHSARSWRRPPCRTPGRPRRFAAATGAGGHVPGRSWQGHRRRSATRASAYPRLHPRSRPELDVWPISARHDEHRQARRVVPEAFRPARSGCDEVDRPLQGQIGRCHILRNRCVAGVVALTDLDVRPEATDADDDRGPGVRSLPRLTTGYSMSVAASTSWWRPGQSPPPA